MQTGAKIPVLLALLGSTGGTACGRDRQGERSSAVSLPTIPRTWDAAALATLEVPLPTPAFSPKAVSSDY